MLLALSSDHISIYIRLQMKTPSNPGLRRTYINLKNANWDRYRQEVDAAQSSRSLPTYCQSDEKIFRTVLLKAASHYIPTGRHRLHEEPVPTEILDVMSRRDDLRKRDPTSPGLPRLNKAIQNRICVHKRQKWRDFVETMDQKTDLTKLWRTIKGIDGRPKREAEKEQLPSMESRYHRSKQLATKFNQQFNTSKLSDSGYMEDIINHPYAEAWQGHLPRNFLSTNLVTLSSRRSHGISALTHNQQISTSCTRPTQFQT